ncbi:MAG: hypothetical protein IJ382_00725 [Flavobacteriales bacterium]|nr:hypothetical protein [Flavobacteriales bacterium]PWM10977.1 MAG: hypothetical protein DBY00_04925 [Flavobacteriales bacterium]
MQDNISFTQLLLTLAGALGIRELAPVVFSAVFRRSEDVESARIDNSAKLQAASREQVKFLKDSLREAYEEVDKMQDALNAKRALINELSRKLYNIELELQVLRRERDGLYCCEVGCKNRKNEPIIKKHDGN